MLSAQPHVIETRKLTMRFGDVTALDAVDIAVEKGQFVALMGVSGSG